MVLKKSEDNDNEMVASMRTGGFALIPEDDGESSIIEDDLSDALNPLPRPVDVSQVEESKGPSGSDNL